MRTRMMVLAAMVAMAGTAPGCIAVPTRQGIRVGVLPGADRDPLAAALVTPIVLPISLLIAKAVAAASAPRACRMPDLGHIPLNAPPPVAAEVFAAQGRRLDERARSEWARWLTLDDVEKRWRAAKYLASLEVLPPESVAPLVACAHHHDAEVRRHALLALAGTSPARAAEAARVLLRGLDDARPLVRFAAANALERLGGPAVCVLPELRARLAKVRSPELRRHLAKAVRTIHRSR